MPRYYSSSRHSRESSRALQHIEEARQLSHELGGSDQDVKAYFFGLSPAEREPILDEYGHRYGLQAKEYAEQTLHKWRSGRVHMSGMVASRLFNLLPPMMPLATKLNLIQNLWHHYGPASRKVVRFGLQTDVEEVAQTVQGHIDDVVVHYQIPEMLENRFRWISGGDVAAKQELLNFFRQQEKQLALAEVRLHVPVMLEHYSGNGAAMTHSFSDTLKIGKHEVVVLIDPNATGVTLEEPQVLRPKRSFDWSWLWWVAAIGAGAAYFLLK